MTDAVADEVKSQTAITITSGDRRSSDRSALPAVAHRLSTRGCLLPHLIARRHRDRSPMHSACCAGSPRSFPVCLRPRMPIDLCGFEWSEGSSCFSSPCRSFLRHAFPHSYRLPAILGRYPSCRSHVLARSIGLSPTHIAVVSCCGAGICQRHWLAVTRCDLTGFGRSATLKAAVDVRHLDGRRPNSRH